MVMGQYRGWDPDRAVDDYYKRIRDHEKHYETVEETTWPFIRIFNVGAAPTPGGIDINRSAGRREDYGQCTFVASWWISSADHSVHQNIHGYLQVRML